LGTLEFFMIASLILVAIALLMILIERLIPGHKLPKVKGWVWRMLLVDAVQVGVILAFGYWAEPLIVSLRMYNADGLGVIGGALIGYLAITFVYYWWHRFRHEVPWLWRVLHQVHHSPQRLEIVTSFYKHPLEIVTNALLSATLLYIVLGLNPAQVTGVVIISAVAELFYHWNVRTPRWVGWFIQRPEMHRLHHGAENHAFNYGDLPLWDWMFGTYKNPATYEAPCGFPEDEHRLGEMLQCKEVVATPKTFPHPNAARAFLSWWTPHRRAYALVTVGALAMAGEALQSSHLTGLGLITGAAPYPKVFTSRDGLEGFSSSFKVTWEEGETTHEQLITPEHYSALQGPYNRRNVYGAALAGGPFLSSQETTRPMLEAVSQYSFCDGTLLEELQLSSDASHIRIEVIPRPDAGDTHLPLTWEVACS
jgi:sterol desaturase/sphingolipid hydroxylase (fatty acid hydroxylase superfamily)